MTLAILQARPKFVAVYRIVLKFRGLQFSWLVSHLRNYFNEIFDVYDKMALLQEWGQTVAKCKLPNLGKERSPKRYNTELKSNHSVLSVV